MKSKNQLLPLEIEGLNFALNVFYDIEYHEVHIRVEECHGLHSFDDSYFDVEIHSVMLGNTEDNNDNLIEIKQLLSKKMIEEIESAIIANYEF